MKKIVILGGGKNQIPLIRVAKELGYYVVLCDFRDNVEGIALSDVHYLVDTLCYDEIAFVCERENPDGIISNSEPAMPIVALISEAFGLVGNRVDGIQTLMSKNRFRALQSRVGCFTPKFFEVTTCEELWQIIDQLEYPIIIKPGQCSSSRGSRRINWFDKELISKVFTDCLYYTFDGKVVVEEFIEMPSLTTVEGDLFVHEGRILYGGLFSTTRAKWVPMVPMTYTAPLVMNADQVEIVKQTLGKIFEAAGIKHGEYNIEGYFTETGEFFIIEINVRQGGNNIPMLIRDFTGIDYSRLLVTTAVGNDDYWKEVKDLQLKPRNIIKHAVYSQFDVKYGGLYIDSTINDKVYRIIEYKQKNDIVHRCMDGTSGVALVDMEFQSREEQLRVYDRMDELIKVKTLM